MAERRQIGRTMIIVVGAPRDRAVGTTLDKKHDGAPRRGARREVAHAGGDGAGVAVARAGTRCGAGRQGPD